MTGGLEILLLCLSLVAYFEERGGSTVGQMATAHVTLTRALARPDRDVCAVIAAPGQYPWAAEKMVGGVLRPEYRPDRASAGWVKAAHSARLALYSQDFTGGATHFHAVTIPMPTGWAHMQRRGVWGRHVYYYEDHAKWKKISQ